MGKVDKRLSTSHISRPDPITREGRKRRGEKRRGKDRGSDENVGIEDILDLSMGAEVVLVPGRLPARRREKREMVERIKQEEKPKEERILKLRDIEFDIPGWSVMRYVGLGSGKGSLLHGFIGGKSEFYFPFYFNERKICRCNRFLRVEIRRMKGSASLG
jgi:hypothetical protein